MKEIFEKMAIKWPSAIVAREKVGEFTGGAVSPGYLANLDSRGEGPKGKTLIGRKVVYSVLSLAEWLDARSHQGAR